MKVKANQSELLEALGALLTLTEKKTTMPILSNILVKVAGNTAVLTATDLEVGADIELPVQVLEDGDMAVPARNLHDIVREAPQNAPIELESLPNRSLYIKAGHAQFRLSCPDPREFPSLTGREGDKRFTVSGEFLAKMLAKVAFAMSRDETRYHLNGVYFDGRKEGILRLVATDGHRLAYMEGKVAFPEDYRAIVPRKGCAELQKFCERADKDTVDVYLGKRYIHAESADRRLMIRLIDGDFPKYEQVIPKDNDREIQVSKVLLASALRRVCILANERSFGIRVSFSTGHIEISTQSSEKGEGKEELECAYRGEFFQMGFNARYFLDVLSVMEGETVVLKMKGNLSPCLLSSEEDVGWQAVLMPMRI